MNLDDALEKVTAWIPKKLAFPPTPQMVHASHEVAEYLRDVSASVDLIDLNDLRNRLVQARTTGTWETISSRDWRYVAECLGISPHPLIDDENFLDEYLRQLRGQRSRLAVSRLIRFYLTYFDPNRPGIQKIAKFLMGIVSQWQWGWAERQTAIGIFDISTAPKRFAEHIMNSTVQPSEVMDATGFGGSFYGSRLAGHAYMFAAQNVYNMLIQNPSSLLIIKRFASWGMVGDRFAFGSTPRAMARMAESMLLPWVNRTAPDDVRVFIEAHLLSLLHDLRIDQSRWLDVDEKAKLVMRQWLTRASLEQFLDVVDRTAQNHMWPARRKFWYAFYEHKVMQEAWVAFAKDGASVAKRLAAEKENPAIGNFGVLVPRSGVLRDQAVLVMQIGNLVVADWSHSGKCHIWQPDNPYAPKLYHSYHRNELVNNSDFEKAHRGAWQIDVYNFIRYHTNINMKQRDYM